MFMGLGMPIPDLSNKPGPGRPGWSAGTYDFQFEVTGAVTIKAQPAATGQSFTIKWPNGTEQTTTGSNSIAAPDGTAGVVSINKKTDSTYADQFGIVGGQANVSKVLSWGANPWKGLANAFQNCSNLTSLSDTTLTTGSTCNFQYAFNDCTSLEYVDLRKWDLSQGVNTTFWFEGCSNLGEIDMTGSSISLYSRSDNMFANIGSSTTDGCLFKMSGVNWSNTANSQWYNMFSASRIKKDSTFANWVFPSSMTTNISFYQCVFKMQDTVLDCSGWTTYSSTSLPNFSQLNYYYNGYAQPPSSSTGFKIDITNLNVSNVTNLQQAFYYSFQDEVVGLSTLGATNGATSMSIMFAYNKFMKFTATNNFSNTFMSSLN